MFWPASFTWVCIVEIIHVYSVHVCISGSTSIHKIRKPLLFAACFWGFRDIVKRILELARDSEICEFIANFHLLHFSVVCVCISPWYQQAKSWELMDSIACLYLSRARTSMLLISLLLSCTLWIPLLSDCDDAVRVWCWPQQSRFQWKVGLAGSSTCKLRNLE
jgi:hypothetical protein